MTPISNPWTIEIPRKMSWFVEVWSNSTDGSRDRVPLGVNTPPRSGNSCT